MIVGDRVDPFLQAFDDLLFFFIFFEEDIQRPNQVVNPIFVLLDDLGQFVNLCLAISVIFQNRLSNFMLVVQTKLVQLFFVGFFL